MAGLGEAIGLALSGGDIDRESARLEGLDLGSKISARKATTQNALAQARLRVDEAEAREGLADELELGGMKAIAATIRAGGNPEQMTGAMLDQQQHQGIADLPGLLAGGGTDALAGVIGAGANPEQFTGAMQDNQNMGLADIISDVSNPFEERQAAAQAANPSVVDPFQMQGGLFADVFNPGDAPELAPTNPFDDAADSALARQRNASARLSDEKRKHPERFRSADGSVNGDAIIAHFLPNDGKGTSVIPDDVSLEQGFGAEAFFSGAVNQTSDFFGGDQPFPHAARSQEIMQELASRIQIGMLADLPMGGRPNMRLLELLSVYAEDPRQMFRGDASAVNNLRSTLAASQRNLDDIKLAIRSPSEHTNTDQAKMEASLIKTANLVADLEKALSIVTAGKSANEAGLANDVTAPELPPGWTVQVID